MTIEIRLGEQAIIEIINKSDFVPKDWEVRDMKRLQLGQYQLFAEPKNKKN